MMSSAKQVVLVAPEIEHMSLELPGGWISRKMYRIPPIGILYVSAALRNAGYGTVIVDGRAEGDDLPKLLRLADDPGTLFVGMYSSNLSEQRVCRRIKGLSKIRPVVVGGPGALTPEPYLRAGAAAVCVGEGDHTVVEIARRIQQGSPLDDVAGLAILRNDEIRHTKPRPFIEDLDALPFPDWLHMPRQRYCNHYGLTSREPYFALITTRGCPMNCKYCSTPAVWRHTTRRRSVENVIEEILLLKEHFGVRYIDFLDDIFLTRNDWTERFCDQLLRRGIKLSWSCIAYPSSVPMETIKLMRRAGCDTLKVGLQAVHPQVLRAVNRSPRTVPHCADLIAKARACGMQTMVDLIYGLPGDDYDSLKAVEQFMLEIDPTLVKTSELSILPGSAFATEGCDPPAIHWSAVRRMRRRMVQRFYLRPSKVVELLSYVFDKPALSLGVPLFAVFLLRNLLGVRVLLGKPAG